MSATYVVLEPGFTATPGFTISYAEVYDNDLLITDQGDNITDDSGNQIEIQ